MDDLSWLKRISNSNHFICDGDTMLREWRAESRDYKIKLDIPSLMQLSDAQSLAPTVHDDIERLRSGTALLDFVERTLGKVMGESGFAQNWPKGLSEYTDLQPVRLQRLAYDVLCVTTDYVRETAAISIMTYALIGLASQVKSTPRYFCRLCYRTAVSKRRYCELHQMTRDDRIIYTKKRRRESENRDVVRRRAERIRKLAIGLQLKEDGPYQRMFWQLRSTVDRAPDVPPMLEDIQDNGFVMGDRIGDNGATWLIYSWEVLPRMQKVLGPDWPELVRSALKRKYWTPVLQRLGTIDPHQHVTDAGTWAWTLITAEAWAEAEEMERQQPHRGRPRRDQLDPQVLYAKKQLSDGRSVTDVARNIGVSPKTIYRWSALPFIISH